MSTQTDSFTLQCSRVLEYDAVRLDYNQCYVLWHAFVYKHPYMYIHYACYGTTLEIIFSSDSANIIFYHRLFLLLLVSLEIVVYQVQGHHKTGSLLH